MIEKWKRDLNENINVGAIFMGFDTLNHRFVLAKVQAYGLQSTAVKKLENYLTGRFQRTKISNSSSSWSKITTGVFQGYIVGPLLFNIFLDGSVL